MAWKRIGNLNNRWIGKSYETKPTAGIPVGATALEYDTGKLYTSPDGSNWILKSAEGAIFQATTIDLKQVAGDYDLFTAGLSDIEILHLTIIIPSDLTDEENLTSISIQSTDDTPVEFISATVGAVANLTANKYLQYDAGETVAGGKKIQLTIGGGATAASQICTVFVAYREAV